MSDHVIFLVAKPPHHTPEQRDAQQAKDLFWKIAPHADEIEVFKSENIEFIYSYQNDGPAVCPSCGFDLNKSDDLKNAFASDVVENNYGHTFQLKKYDFNCCSSKFSLDQIIANWTFGRFALKARNPKIGKLTPDTIAKFEEALDCETTVIYAYI